MKRIYALYKGEKNLTDRTKQELADYLKVKKATIEFYTTKAHRRRTTENAYRVIFIGKE